ncbi:flagellar basal body L-ring protein FlgH [Vibrio sp. MEBiC08052]|uniref:flagellar basal body L-ring protein FlgH n=1 Tax=Vibrio sp. MEBiC08052 TaxID=1761910 RepID=UPI0007408941|nr:flagellar basal body L-ring protein FlgH [Vibrio sp. MEBiC08052]KUI97025.1 hypothetical protein VRK_38800 [Vibrio sp. MEBiC08052]
MKVKILAGVFLWLLIADAHAEDFFQSGGFVSLVSDNRAHQIGDTLTVLIVENTKAASRAGTGSDSKTDISANLLSPEDQKRFGLGYNRGSQGDANTQREGRFKGQIAVKVIDIDPHGLLQVSGEQLLLINGEEQRIALTGLLRPIDVRDDNTVLSSRITDAHIEFDGAGDVNDGQSPGLITRIFNWLGL